MPDYQKMYYTVCAAASQALDALPVINGNALGRKTLENALLEAEDIYIGTSDIIQFPPSDISMPCEEELLSRLRACAPRDRQTAFKLLDVYLRSLNE